MERADFVIRDFGPDNAESCFRIRSAGFINHFYPRVGPEKVAALVNSYMPADFVRMSETMKRLVCERHDETAGVPVIFPYGNRRGVLLSLIQRAVCILPAAFFLLGEKGIYDLAEITRLVHFNPVSDRLFGRFAR